MKACFAFPESLPTSATLDGSENLSQRKFVNYCCSIFRQFFKALWLNFILSLAFLLACMSCLFYGWYLFHIWLKMILHQKKIHGPTLIFWIEMGYGITRFGWPGPKNMNWSFSLLYNSFRCTTVLSETLPCPAMFSLGYFVMLLFVEGHSLPSPAKVFCSYDFWVCELLKHLSTWISFHRCRKNVRHQWYDLLPHDYACVCNTLLSHKHCM